MVYIDFSNLSCALMLCPRIYNWIPITASVASYGIKDNVISSTVSEMEIFKARQHWDVL